MEPLPTDTTSFRVAVDHILLGFFPAIIETDVRVVVEFVFEGVGDDDLFGGFVGFLEIIRGVLALRLGRSRGCAGLLLLRGGRGSVFSIRVGGFAPL